MTATISADTAREHLTRFLDSGNNYQFLDLAEPYVHACPDDGYVRLMAIREYLRLGLVVPAKELLVGTESSPDAAADFESVRRSLSSVRSSSIPWESASSTLDSNLQAWHARDSVAELVRRCWETRRAEFQWYKDRNGTDQVRMRDPAGRWRWIPYLGQHRAVDATRPLPPGLGDLTPGPFLFDGLDLGHYFRRVYDATRDTFLGFSCAMFVVEPDPALLAILLHLHDWRDIVADPRAFWFVGKDATQRLRSVWDSDTDLPFPRQAMRFSTFRRECDPPAVSVVEAAGAAREQEAQDSLRDLETRYAARDCAHWAKRFDDALSGQADPLRILAVVSIHTTFLQHSMRDAKRAFESLGQRCIVLAEKANHTILGPLTYHRAIREFDPDLFFVLDHVRPEFDMLLPRNLPVFTWDQDNLPQVFTADNIRRISKIDFLAGCSKSVWVQKGGDPKQFLHARLPTCPEQFSGPPLTAEEKTRYTCDVSFVSHSSQTPAEFHAQERAKCADKPLASLLDCVFELLPAELAKHSIASGLVAESVLQAAERRSGLTARDPELRSWLCNWYIWRLGDRMFRHEALQWVADWARRTGKTFRIYGNGWDRHPTLKAFAAGPANQGRELLCIYRASAINLQLMPAGFIHQRALDGLAAGGFFLARFVPHDFGGRALRPLDRHLRELQLATRAQVLECPDELLKQCLANYYGDLFDQARNHPTDFVEEIRLAAELSYPDEVFPRFSEMVFNSAETFATAADRFLTDAPTREDIAKDMRRIVVERFSYGAEMRRFLEGMRDYLAAKTR